MKLLFSFVLLAAISNFSHAALVEYDLFSTGDGLITRDTQTGLEWLDNSALPSNVHWYELHTTSLGQLGFRFASMGEIVELILTNGGYPCSSYYDCAATPTDVVANSNTILNDIFVASGLEGFAAPYISETVGCDTTMSGCFDGPTALIFDGYNFSQFIALSGDLAECQFLLGSDNADGCHRFTVNLVRSAIPIPAAAWLFGSALFGLAAASRNHSSSLRPKSSLSANSTCKIFVYFRHYGQNIFTNDAFNRAG